ncbi:MAG: LacI family DNA-binding transcriptional regulator [Terriglobia bacterium]
MKRQKRKPSKRRKSPNIYDVAREAGVSVFTVSAVINKTGQASLTLQRRVETAIEKLNYRPNLLARSLAKRKTHTIGVVVPDIANPFFPLVVRGAEDTAQKADYSILLCNSDDRREKEELYVDLLISKRVDGILLTKTPGQFSLSLRRTLAETKVPVVLLMRTCPRLTADAVVTDDVKGAFEAVSHLGRVGHRTIALVGGPPKVSNAKARWQGYRNALQAHGLRYDPDLVFEGDYRIGSGHRAGLTLLPRRPDAVFVANYLMTVGFMKAAEEMRMRCPEDFALVSFDDYPWLGYFRPRLTTVELPKYKLGALGAEILLQRMAGKRGRTVKHKLMPQLCVRDSCGFTLHQSRREAANPTFSSRQ